MLMLLGESKQFNLALINKNIMLVRNIKLGMQKALFFECFNINKVITLINKKNTKRN